MSGPGKGHAVVTDDLRGYSQSLGFYSSEADKFGNLVDQADVTDQSWGLIGLAVKQSYTDKLAELRELLQTMKEGVDVLSDKMTTAADVYEGYEQDTIVALGKHQTKIEGSL